MRRFKLTSKEVLSLPYELVGTKYYYDQKLAGFGLRVGKISKTYFVEAGVNGKSRRVKIGASEIFTVEQARKIAQTHLGSRLSELTQMPLKRRPKPDH